MTISAGSYLEKRKFVIGIHISADHVSCSLAFENNPFKILHIDDWLKHSTQEQTHLDSVNSKYPTSVVYKEEDDKFICGPVLPYEHGRHHTFNVYELISEYIGNNNKLLEEFENLDIIKVLSAFFTHLFQEADKFFEAIFKEEKELYLDLHDFEIKKGCCEAEKRKQIEEKFTYNRLEHCRYCISGPLDEQYKILMRDVFINTGFISNQEAQERLLFVSNASSLGHYLNSLNEYHDEFTDGSKFIVCDISYDAVNFSIVKVDATASKGVIQALDINNAPSLQEWRPLETIYRRYLSTNGFSDQKVEEQIEIFKNRIKKFDGVSIGDVLQEFLDPITSTLSSLYTNDESIKKVYCFGDLALHPQISEIIQSFDMESGQLNNPEFLSKGATTYALTLENMMLPEIVHNINSTEKGSSMKKKEDKVISSFHDLIMGIDFGTTHSGISFAVPGVNSMIHSVRDWPSTELHKAPTLLLYNTKKDKLENEWGGTAKSMINKETEIIDSFKLLLSPKSIKNYYGPGNSDVDKIIKKNNLGSLDITQMIVHYLKRLIKTALKSVESTIPSLKRNPRIKYILTVPCMWTEAAKTTMLDAAVKAGLANNEDEITLITEPEAAALYFDRTIERLSPLHSYFIVCDAGGGTVDLVTYATETDEETNNRNSIQQFGEGCGDTCGSNQINQLFARYLMDCFPNELRKRKEFFRYLIDKFEIMKYDFTGKESHIPFPLPKFMRRVTDYMQTPGTCVIKDGKLYIRGKIIKDMFDIMIQKTINLLEIEYKKTQHIQRVKQVIMVGGFSRSPYLRSEVEKWCKSKDIELSGDGGNLMIAVSHGAVSYGLDPRLVTRRTAGQTYALLVEQAPGIKELSHFIRRNDVIDPENHYIKKIALDSSCNMVIAIFSYDGTRGDGNKADDSRTYYKDSYSKVLEVRVDKHKCKEAVFVKLQFTPTGVECYVFYDGLSFEYGAASASNTYSYRLRHPGLKRGVDAMKVLNELKYAPYHTQPNKSST